MTLVTLSDLFPLDDFRLFAFCAFAWLRFCTFGAFGPFGAFGACKIIFVKKKKESLKLP